MPEHDAISTIVDAEKEAAKMLFGLAVAISAIPLLLRLPNRPFGIIVDISEFGFSFLILISVWLGYWNIVSILPLEDRTTVALNIAILFLISVEPYLFYLNITFDILTHEVLLNISSILYALDMAGLMVILALFMQQLLREERGAVPKQAMLRYKHFRDILLVSATLFAVTILPVFWFNKLFGQPIRFYFWFIPLVISSISILSERGFQQ
jgi:hypothetical protein